MTHHVVDNLPIHLGHPVVEDRLHQGMLRSEAVRNAGSRPLALRCQLLHSLRCEEHCLIQKRRTCLHSVSDRRPSLQHPQAPQGS